MTREKRARRTTKASALVLTVLLMLTPAAAAGTEIIDYGTTRNGMRSCPVNMFVTGVDLDGNRLLCDDSYGRYTPVASFEVVDLTTMVGSRKSCPRNYGVTGVSPVRNGVSCAHRGLMQVEVHTSTIRLGMKACPRGSVVVGVGLEDNSLRCGTREDFCFGALGQRCGITREGLDTPLALCLNGRCWINSGSWLHDQCCWRSPNGYACRGGPTETHDGSCVADFGRAVAHMLIGYRWIRDVNFGLANRGGTVIFGQYCAENGWIVHRMDVTPHCCSRRGRPLEFPRDAAAVVRQELSPTEVRNGNARACF
jgi:hypothetical protein